MRISVLVLAVLTGVSVCRATTLIVGDGIGINPGYLSRDSVVIGARGGLTLMAPGTYIAESWSISGELRLGAPGTYIVVASIGSIALNGSAKVRGPAGATAQLTFAHAGEYISAAPEIDSNVTIRRSSAAPLDSPPLVNISTRATVAAGQTHVSGFVVGGRTPRRVLVRAIGPALAAFGVTNALATPVLTVLNGQRVVGTNSGWAPEWQVVFLMVGAFGLPANSRDAAMVLTLDPGSYTVQVNGGTGEVLLEVYYVD